MWAPRSPGEPPTPPPPPTGGGSPDGTTVPSTATQIVDNTGAVWTIGPSFAILRNGVSAAGGAGSQIQWNGGIVYVLGLNGSWYRWTGSDWLYVAR